MFKHTVEVGQVCSYSDIKLCALRECPGVCVRVVALVSIDGLHDAVRSHILPRSLISFFFTARYREKQQNTLLF